jgi:hypothetical protein
VSGGLGYQDRRRRFARQSIRCGAGCPVTKQCRSRPGQPVAYCLSPTRRRRNKLRLHKDRALLRGHDGPGGGTREEGGPPRARNTYAPPRAKPYASELKRFAPSRGFK